MSGDRNMYIKKGRKYVPVGLWMEKDWLPDGIWMVLHKPGMVQKTNLLAYAKEYGIHKVGEIPTIDFTRMAGIEREVDAIAAIIANNTDKVYSDVARKILDYLTSKERDDGSN